jgi:hypothetical protein
LLDFAKDAVLKAEKWSAINFSERFIMKYGVEGLEAIKDAKTTEAVRQIIDASLTERGMVHIPQSVRFGYHSSASQLLESMDDFLGAKHYALRALRAAKRSGQQVLIASSAREALRLMHS